ncbi:MAG: hypothetical protein ACKOPQ_05840 [Novosphingobium sp.]|jgi:hypothetical protein
MSKFKLALGLLALGTIQVPALAQTPPVIVPMQQRPPINPAAVAAMQAQAAQGNLDCVTVNNVELSGTRKFLCTEASGKQTLVNFYEKALPTSIPQDNRIIFSVEQQIDHSEAMLAVVSFFQLKQINPGSKARLRVFGGTSAEHSNVYVGNRVMLMN